MSFHEVRFPEDISYGATGGPKFNTTVIELASGFEQRNINWSNSRAEYDVSHGLKDEEGYHRLLSFFYERKGKAFGFRFKDHMDYVIKNQEIIPLDNNGSIYQIYKLYSFDFSNNIALTPYRRDIKKLVMGSVRIYSDEYCNTIVASDINNKYENIRYDAVNVQNNNIVYTISYNDGIITVNSDNILHESIFLSCEFDVPVRFDIDEMKANIEYYNTYNWQNIPLVEVRI